MSSHRSDSIKHLPYIARVIFLLVSLSAVVLCVCVCPCISNQLYTSPTTVTPWGVPAASNKSSSSSVRSDPRRQPLLTTKMASFPGDLTNGGGGGSPPTTTTMPLTMFYNGGIAVFHLPQDKAEVVMKMAAGEDGRDDGGDGGGHRQPNHGDELLAKLRQGMPVASKISLQRFFQKRKERLHGP